MKKIFLVLSILSVFSYGCATTGVDPQKTQLQIREFQTRSYDTNDTKMVIKAMLNVLQDDGYIVKNANADLGLLTATKEVDVENKTTAIVSSLFGGYNARWNKNSIIECSANISEFGNETRVRVNFLTKMMNNKGEVVQVKQIEDQTFYEQFFSKVSKGVFLQKEKLG
jgi:PBP1b-binding outer membrane lipoprotein LpoB